MTRTLSRQNWLDRRLGLQPEERFPALLLTLTGALLIGGYTVAKSVRDSLFLANYPAERLPLLLLVLAVLTAPVVSAYTKLAGRMHFKVLAPAFYALVAVGFFFLERLNSQVSGWPAILLYFYVSLLCLLAVTQFWLVLGWRFSTREARRLIALIGSGNIVGGMLGGFLASGLAQRIGPELMLWVVAGIFALAGVLSAIVTWSWKRSPTTVKPEQQEKQKETESAGILPGLRKIGAHPLLRWALFLLVLTVLLSTLTDYQLKAVAKEAYPEKNDLVRFFGNYYAISGVLTMFLQLGVTQWLLKRWGVTGGLLTMPVALLPGCAAMLLAPGIFAATLLKGAEYGVRNSAWRSGYEILFLPLSTTVRKQTKPILDVFVERSADGLAGLLILLLATVAGVGPQGLTWLTLSSALLLAVVILKLRTAYVSTLENNLAQAVNAPLSHSLVLDGMTLHTLDFHRGSAQDLGLLQSLEMSLHVARFSDMPMDLLKHPSEEIRSQALTLLDAFGKNQPPSQKQVQRLRQQAEEWERNPQERETRAAPATEENAETTASLPHQEEHSVSEMFNVLCSGAGSPYLFSILQRLQKQPDLRLVGALIPLLGESGPVQKKSAQAISALGLRAAGTLADHLLNPELSLKIRRQCAALLGKLDSPLAENALQSALFGDAPELGRAASAGLYNMRRRGFAKALDTQQLLRLLRPELQRNQSIWEADDALQSASLAARSRGALAQSIRKGKDRTMRHVFRLLGLGYPAEAIQASYQALTMGEKQVQEQALEYLDNVLSDSLRQLVWPFLAPNESWKKEAPSKKLEEIAQDLFEAGAAIDLPAEVLDLSIELSSSDEDE